MKFWSRDFSPARPAMTSSCPSRPFCSGRSRPALSSRSSARLANPGNLGRDGGQLSRYDPGSAHAMNNLSYTPGMAWNVAKIKEHLGQADHRLGSGAASRKPTRIRRLRRLCARQPARRLPRSALNYLKLDPNSKGTGRTASRRGSARGPASLMKKSLQPNISMRSPMATYASRSAGPATAFRPASARGRPAQMRHRLCDPQRRHADVDGQFRHSRGRAAFPKPVQFIDFCAAGRRGPHRQGHQLRQWRPAHAAGRQGDRRNDPSVYPSEATMGRLFTVTAPDEPIRNFITHNGPG